MSSSMAPVTMTQRVPKFSIIVPVLNESAQIDSILQALMPLRQHALGAEIIVVDGASQDDTLAHVARYAVDRCLRGPRGRALQMNQGAQIARGSILLFLHADTTLPADALDAIESAIRSGAQWGRFDVAIKGRSMMLPVVAALINLRSRYSKIATGDQALFIQRPLFDAIGQFPVQALMEDVELCLRLRQHSPPACLRQKVVTSGRRWDQRGAWRTIVLMWRLRWQYWRGTPAEQLVQLYR